MTQDAIILDVTSSQINSGVAKANAITDTATQINIKLNDAKDLRNAVVTGSNLYNKDTITEGYYVHNSNGNLVAASGYNASDWIIVKPSTTYTKRTTSTFALYDENKSYISGGSGTRTISTTATTKYVRISVEDNMKNTNTLVEGSSQSYDTAYYNQFLYENPYDNLFHDIRGTYQTVHKIEAGTYAGQIDQIDHYRSSDNVKIRSDVFTYETNKVTEVRTLDATNTKLTYIRHTDTDVTEVI